MKQKIATITASGKRRFLKRAAFLGLGGLLAYTSLTTKGYAVFGLGKSDKDEKTFPYQLSEEEWKKRLSPEAYKVLRKDGTEPAGSSPLNDIKEKGIFHCKGCDHPLFSSAAKFDSGTGWPSFTQPINDSAIGTSTDYKLFYPRTEVHCANCGGHLGHVFEDGPEPTGLRYCMNGVAMTFKPAT